MSVEQSTAQEASIEDSFAMDATSASSHTSNPRPSSLRWQILRRALLRRPPTTLSDQHSEMGLKRISRKATQGFNLIPYHLHQQTQPNRPKDALLCYSLPLEGNPNLFLTQRVDNLADLNDFEICNRYDIDNTGLVCNWPSEEVLAYFCLSHADMFRSKRVIELGSGYGLAGLVIAVATEASEVVISDGNPQVVDYIKHNIDANSSIFGGTKVELMNLHWNQEEISSISNTFDIIVASDCTFFKEFHGGLVRTIKLLLKNTEASEAIFFSPKRGDSLEKFLEEVKRTGLRFSLTENYDAQVWKCHQKFMNGDDYWPSYDKDHCFPLLIRIML